MTGKIHGSFLGHSLQLQFRLKYPNLVRPLNLKIKQFWYVSNCARDSFKRVIMTVNMTVVMTSTMT